MDPEVRLIHVVYSIYGVNVIPYDSKHVWRQINECGIHCARGTYKLDTVDLCAIIAKFNCIPMKSREQMQKWQCNGDFAAIIASNADTK